MCAQAAFMVTSPELIQAGRLRGCPCLLALCVRMRAGRPNCCRAEGTKQGQQYYYS